MADIRSSRDVAQTGDDDAPTAVHHHPTPTALSSTPSLGLVANIDDVAPGTMIGDYRIGEMIGEGGWATVYSAVHPVIGKRAAVKVLKKELCAREDAVQRFIDEARAVNQIGHPNIVDVFAFGQLPDGRSYSVMEWLKGETLYERIQRGPLRLDETCAIVKQLARALAAVHASGIVHRDLKPQNVFLVDVPGEPALVKLLDFGIAKLMTNEIRKTTSGQIIGTPLYFAPEQARGKGVDHRADIYALGGMLFELLTGKTPFVADNAGEMIALHLSDAPPRPSSIASNVPAELDDLVIAMLAKDRADRPSLDALSGALDRAGHASSPRTPKKSRRWVAAVFAVAVAGAATGLVASQTRTEPRQPAAPAPQAQQTQPPPAQQTQPPPPPQAQPSQPATPPGPTKPEQEATALPSQHKSPAKASLAVAPVVRRNPKLGKQVVQKPVKKPDVQPDPVKQPDVQPNPGDGSNEERMLYRPGEVKGR